MRRFVRSVAVSAAAAVIASVLHGAVAPPPAASVPDLPGSAPVENYTRRDLLAAQVLARASGQRVEVTGERTASTTTFVEPDGTLTLEAAAGPVRVRRGDGWVPLDTTLESDGTGVRPRAVPDEIVFGGAGSTELARLTRGSGVLRMGWTSPLPAPVLSGDTATYPSALVGVPGADLRVRALRTGFEQSLLLNVRPLSPLTIRLPLELGGLRMSKTADGDLRLNDLNGNEVAVAPAPLMWGAARDAMGDPTRIARVDTEVQQGAGGSVTLVLRPDPAFLADPSVTLPITVDPSAHLTRTADTWVYSTTPYSTQASSSELRVGRYPTTGTSRALLKFDTAPISGAQVLNAELSLYQWAAPSCTAKTSRVYALTGPFSDATVWTDQPGISATAYASSTQVYGASGCPSWWVRYDVDSLVAAWADGTIPNHGLEVRSANESDTGALWRFYSINNTGPQLPTLAVSFNSLPGKPVEHAADPCHGQCTSPTRVRSATPTLRAASTDPDGEPVSMLFELWNAGHTGLIETRLVEGVASGAPVAFTPATSLTDGVSYDWRVYATDGTDFSPASDWFSFTVDTTAPNAPTVSSSQFPSGQWAGTHGGSGTWSLGNGGSTDVVGRYYGLDVNPPASYTTATSVSLSGLAEGPHRLYVQSVDAAGNRSPLVEYPFQVGQGGITTPLPGARTAGQFTLTAVTKGGGPTRPYTALTWVWRRSASDAWAPLTGLTDTSGSPLTQPLSVSDTGTVPAVRWNAAAQAGADGPLEVRAELSGSGGAVVLQPRALTLDRVDFGRVTASEQVGPVSVNLLTGNAALPATDVSVDAYASDLTVARTYNSRAPHAEPDGPFGPGWVSSVPVDTAGSDFTKLTVTGPTLVTLTSSDGDAGAFVKLPDGTFEPEVGDEDLALSYLPAADRYDVIQLDGTITGFTPPTMTTTTAATTGTTVSVVDGTRVAVGQRIDVKNGVSLLAADRAVTAVTATSVTFGGTGVSVPSGAKLVPAGTYVASSVQQPGDPSATSYAYETVGGVTRISRVLAPLPPDVSCTTASPNVPGCRSLGFAYAPAGQTLPGDTPATWGDYPGRLRRVSLTALDTGTGQMGTIDLAAYAYDSTGRLRAAWDPRLPDLKTSYDYDSAGHLTTLTPPGELPWTLTYRAAVGDPDTGRLWQVSRSALTAGTATWTVVYGVPVAGAGAPYDLSAGQLDRTGQAEASRPTDATAIFPPTQIPSDPPSSYERATITYLDVEGREVNTAAPGGGITTTEYDTTGNVVRTLTAGNRRRALDASPSDNATAEAALARSLSTMNIYSADGLDLLETFGPEHEITLAAGTTVRARAHTVNRYDEGAPAGGPYHLLTSSTTGARVAGETTDRDTRTSRTEYATTTDWQRRTPTATVEAAGTGGLNLTSRMSYTTDGLLAAKTLPGGTALQNTAHTTKLLYYTAGPHPADSACGNAPQWVNLVCATLPAAQPTVATGRPAIPASYLTYTTFNQIRTKTERVGTAVKRTTTTDYDSAGRPWRVTTTGTGTPLPTVETGYDPASGRATETRTVTSTGVLIARVQRGYDLLGRLTHYTDADGIMSTTTYDIMSRPVTTSDGKGRQTRSYDDGAERRGLLTTLTDTAAGTFTATYDTDGTLTTQAYPNGVRATNTIDETGTAVRLDYVKTHNCTTGCTWLSETTSENIHSEQVRRTSNLSSQTYGFDAAGRLTRVEDTTTGGCTTRIYTVDADSNRTGLTSYGPGTGGACQTTTATATTTSTFDHADRITDSLYSYDDLGRTNQVPAAHAGGTALTIGHHVNDLVRSISQGSTSKTSTVDVGQQRFRSWTDGTTTKTNHYADDGDTPTWIAEDATTWTRNITDITGNLAAIEDSASGTTTLQLTNMHGDIVATASTDPAILAPATMFESTEFGAPRDGTTRRYGWLGGKTRPADTIAGIVLMGVRLYNPATGRFLQVDPVPGGSDNPYDYAGHDPINKFDLDGRWWKPRCKWCGKAAGWVRRNAGTIGMVAGIAALGFSTGGVGFALGAISVAGSSVAAYDSYKAGDKWGAAQNAAGAFVGVGAAFRAFRYGRAAGNLRGAYRVRPGLGRKSAIRNARIRYAIARNSYRRWNYASRGLLAGDVGTFTWRNRQS